MLEKKYKTFFIISKIYTELFFLISIFFSRRDTSETPLTRQRNAVLAHKLENFAT